jgi:hypothetical protein
VDLTLLPFEERQARHHDPFASYPDSRIRDGSARPPDLRAARGR